MNLLDDLGNDLAMAFFVEKKYSKKLDTNESLALLGKIREALRAAALVDTGETEAFPAVQRAGIQGN